MIRVKTDRATLMLYAVVIVCATVALVKGAVRWDQIQYAAVALVLPSIFGLRSRKDQEKADA